jgi:hypothetical protein
VISLLSARRSTGAPHRTAIRAPFSVCCTWYWGASTISMFGDQISGIALPLTAVLALHVGAAQMGYLVALEWLPSLLFGLPVGAWWTGAGGAG